MGLLRRVRLYAEESREALRDAERAVGRRLLMALVGAVAAVVTWILTRGRSRNASSDSRES